MKWVDHPHGKDALAVGSVDEKSRRQTVAVLRTPSEPTEGHSNGGAVEGAKAPATAEPATEQVAIRAADVRAEAPVAEAVTPEPPVVDSQPTAAQTVQEPVEQKQMDPNLGNAMSNVHIGEVKG